MSARIGKLIYKRHPDRQLPRPAPFRRRLVRRWEWLTLMPNDIPTWVVVPILILVIGVFAGWIPARRAARVDPNVALRDL